MPGMCAVRVLVVAWALWPGMAVHADAVESDAGLVCAELRAGRAPLPPGGCWEEVSKQPGCYIWNLYPKPVERVDWDGACHGGRAQGLGIARWYIDGRYDNETQGRYEDGKRQGQWLIRKHDGEVWSGTYVDGKRQGVWLERYPDGSVTKGAMLYGKRHGWWLRRDSSGKRLDKTLWRNGEQVEPPE